jgi:diguanylate cyclase (GGDEF)-like protein
VYDPLTRALTRPVFLAALREQVESAEASGHAFCVCLVDVDQLKNINDRQGLRAGDRALSALATRLRATLDHPGWRAMTHVLARYDGDALIVLAQPCTLQQGETLAEALRFHVAETPINEEVGITVSIAVAQFRLGETVDDLLARTERALHAAKQFGTDRVEVSHSPESHPERAPVKRLRE